MVAEMTVAAMVLAAVTVGTVRQWPVFTVTADLGGRIKDYWEAAADTQAPAPNAEKFTIERFARAIGLETDELVSVLRQQGLTFADTDTTIEQLARENQLTPAQVYTVITQHHRDAIRQASP